MLGEMFSNDNLWKFSMEFCWVKTNSELMLFLDHPEYGFGKQNGFQTCLTNEPSVAVLEGSVCEWGGAKNFLGAFCFPLKSTNYSV